MERGLTYLFHSLDVVPVNLGDMLLPLGHQGGSMHQLFLLSNLSSERAREDRKGISRWGAQVLTCSAPTRFSGLLLITAPVNLVITTLPSAPPSYNELNVPNGFISEIPNIFLSLHSTPHDLCNLFYRTNQIDHISRSARYVLQVFPWCFEYGR